MPIPAIILDTEATDFENAEVIELAWREFGGPIAPTVQRFKPTKPSAWGALATHHILMEELEGMPPSDTAPLHVPDASYLIGHNVDFDWKVLGYPEGKRICTLAMSRALWPEVDSHSLVAMTYFTQGATAKTREMVKNAHSAADDVMLCHSLLCVIMEVAKLHTLHEIHEFSEEARIPKIMTFGKFKGEPISAVDRGYMNWYRRQPDTDPYVLEAFRRNGM